MKNRYIILLLLVLFGNVSCKKFLDTKPTDFLAPVNYYETETQLDYALNGVYDILGSVYGGVYLYRMGIEADEGYYARETPDIGPQFYNHAAGHSDIAAFWRNLYSGIYRANILLANLDKNTKISESIRNRVRGEALFLRGYYYFMLVQSFGGVPLIITPTASANDTDVPRATVKEVYDQILTDMKAAEDLVDPITTVGFGGRVNKSAVRGILARVCLFMAGYPLRDQSRYEEARDWAKKVMDDPQAAHQLNNDYSQVFINYAQDKYDIKESIWEVEFWGNDADAYREGGWVGYVNGPQHSNTNTGAGYGGVKTTARLYRKYDNNDLRRDWSIANFNYSNTGVSGTKTMITTTSTSSLYTRSCGKFRREYELVTPKTSKTPQNFPLLRFSDVLLMYAEAENEINPASEEAFRAINLVRRRGFGKLLPGATGAIDQYDLKRFDNENNEIYDRASFAAEIQDERARELAFEELRKGDLIRWGIFVNTMNAVGREVETDVPGAYYAKRYTNVSDKHLLWPIPSYELGLNFALEQNSGW